MWPATRSTSAAALPQLFLFSLQHGSTAALQQQQRSIVIVY